MSEIKLYLTDNPDPIIVPYKSKNTETSLVLVGPDSCNYGEGLLSNLLHVMENFCNTAEPDKPLLGQTYYNKDTKKLNLYGKNGWRQIDNTPNIHNSDVVYVDVNPANISGSLVLSDELKNYISIYGNNQPTKVYSLYEAKNPDDAVTIGYVNKKLAAPDMYYVTRSGISTMEGPLKLKPIGSTDLGSATADIGYVNSRGKLNVVSNQVLNTSSENNGVIRVVIYDVVGRYNDDGLDTNPRFAAIYFSDKFSSTQKTLTINLPIMLKYDGTITCNCTMVDSTDVVILREVGNTSVVIEQSQPKENYVHGCIYGTIDNNIVDQYIASNNLELMPIISPTYSSTPRTVLTAPDPTPSPTPSPSKSKLIAASPSPSPSPTPSPSTSGVVIIPSPSPTPSPSTSGVVIIPSPSPTPSPSTSGVVIIPSPIPTPSPSPSTSEIVIIPSPIPTPSPSPSTSGAVIIPSPSPTPSPSPSESNASTQLCFTNANTQFKFGDVYFIELRVKNGGQGNITVSYDPKGSSSLDFFAITSSQSTDGAFFQVESGSSLSGVNVAGTLTWNHNMPNDGYVVVKVAKPANVTTWDNSWSLCVNYAGGIRLAPGYNL